MTVHALTIDLEDWHQLVRRSITGELTPPTCNVVEATMRLLDALDAVDVRATFFVLGYVAETHPGLIREIAGRGHEIGSHTYSHRVIGGMEREEFEADVNRSRHQLQDLSGQSILGFRAPEFSVGSLDHWAFEVLIEAGFQYDSSVFPVSGPRYGIPGAPRTPFTVETARGSIQEFPLATWRVRGRLLPVGGGTYFRLWPERLLRQAVEQMGSAGGPAVLYFHPYEFATSLLYLAGLTSRQQVNRTYLKFLLAHNLATGRILARLTALLRQFDFQPLGEIYQSMRATPAT